MSLYAVCMLDIFMNIQYMNKIIEGQIIPYLHFCLSQIKKQITFLTNRIWKSFKFIFVIDFGNFVCVVRDTSGNF